ncbi:MAG: DNA-directed RNA polymerase subunit E [Clostridia bacterium]|nr:DNA-directed RNA polymerase subunit E [Candidatus Methanomethylophilaceae archaeon]MBR6955017.1 DNA-directed RNA polymerase subunit E [Clostridia bacterium]
MSDVKNLVACKSCKRLYDSAQLKTSGQTACRLCGGALTKDWQGYLAIIDFEKSEIAKTMGISDNGKYALKVR